MHAIEAFEWHGAGIWVSGGAVLFPHQEERSQTRLDLPDANDSKEGII